MIVKHPSLSKSENVINTVLSNPIVYENEKLNEHTIYIGTYQNGRERGLTLEGMYQTITISENRNSDDIVVYIGTPALSGISKDAWKRAKYFRSEKEAADYIIKNIEKCNEQPTPTVI
jgi:hypothetical protein